MRIVFLGVGEAFDPELPNNSHLVLSETKLLLDCGYSIPSHFWKHYPDPEFLDAIYVSHTHGDHYFGLPILLLALWEHRRSKPLTIIGQKGIGDRVITLTKYAYAGLYDRLPFDLKFIESGEGDCLKLNELSLEFAMSHHSVDNMAIRVGCGKKSLSYSGDGMFTEATVQLYAGTDLLIHEAYTLESEIPTHSNVKDVAAMARKLGIPALAMTHLQRDVRRNKERVLDYIRSQWNLNAFLPEPWDEFDVG